MKSEKTCVLNAQTCSLLLYSAHAGNNIYEIEQHPTSALALRSSQVSQSSPMTASTLCNEGIVLQESVCLSVCLSAVFERFSLTLL